MPPIRQVGLNDLEQETLEHVALGYSNKAIATHFHVSVKTIQKRLCDIYDKLGIASDPLYTPQCRAVYLWRNET